MDVLVPKTWQKMLISIAYLDLGQQFKEVEELIFQIDRQKWCYFQFSYIDISFLDFVTS